LETHFRAGASLAAYSGGLRTIVMAEIPQSPGMLAAALEPRGKRTGGARKQDRIGADSDEPDATVHISPR
jgi:hypothetical protein